MLMLILLPMKQNSIINEWYRIRREEHIPLLFFPQKNFIKGEILRCCAPAIMEVRSQKKHFEDDFECSC